MRKPVILALACVAGSALAKPAPDVLHPGDKPKPIDVKPVADKLEVFRDELGNLYIVPKPDAFSFDEAQQWVFYGDTKTVYRQRIIGASQEGGKDYEWSLWAPRAKGMSVASIGFYDNEYTLKCRHAKDGSRVLKQLNADEARTVIQHATFLPALWQRQAHLLARDDDGVYYYIDELREEYGGNGMRVFVGQKGAMKELAMTNVVADSAGEIYATKTGQLKIVKGQDGKALWIKAGKKTDLTLLEPTDNRYLIYRELGIYGQLGAVCDDL
jgi:hypothetical protein